jgi:hypothetical protein
LVRSRPFLSAIVTGESFVFGFQYFKFRSDSEILGCDDEQTVGYELSLVRVSDMHSLSKRAVV